MNNKVVATESMLEIGVNAAGDGHDLGGFVKVDVSLGMPVGY
jgi:hypothetical protein